MLVRIGNARQMIAVVVSEEGELAQRIFHAGGSSCSVICVRGHVSASVCLGQPPSVLVVAVKDGGRVRGAESVRHARKLPGKIVDVLRYMSNLVSISELVAT